MQNLDQKKRWEQYRAAMRKQQATFRGGFLLPSPTRMLVPICGARPNLKTSTFFCKV